MENREEQTNVGYQVVVFGILESLIVGGLLWVWFFGNAWGEKPVLPGFPYLIGAALLLQLIMGVFRWTSPDSSKAIGKVILYSLLMTAILTPLAFLFLIFSQWLRVVR